MCVGETDGAGKIGWGGGGREYNIIHVLAYVCVCACV